MMKVYKGEVVVTEQEGGHCAESCDIGGEELASLIARDFGGYGEDVRPAFNHDRNGSLIGRTRCGRLRVTVERLPTSGDDS